MKKSVLSLLIGGLLSVGALTAHADEVVNLVRNENAVGQAIAANILTEVYKRAGLTANIQSMPGARANAVTLAGEKDGEVGRIPAYFAKNPTLLKVEPAHYYLTTVAFGVKGKPIDIKSKADLAKYKVGIVRGIAHAEAITEGIPGVQVTGTYDQLYQMLQGGRIDVAIDEGINNPYVMKKLNLTDIEPVAELARLPLNNVLTPAKKDLAPKIAAVITKMKDSGELAKMTKKYEDDFLKSGATP